MYHMNNDTPGTDDGLDDGAWRFADGIVVGARVTAGQLIGWMGDSGNSEGSVPHAHVEIHTPTGDGDQPVLEPAPGPARRELRGSRRPAREAGAADARSSAAPTFLDRRWSSPATSRRAPRRWRPLALTGGRPTADDVAARMWIGRTGSRPIDGRRGRQWAIAATTTIGLRRPSRSLGRRPALRRRRRLHATRRRRRCSRSRPSWGRSWRRSGRWRPAATTPTRSRRRRRQARTPSSTAAGAATAATAGPGRPARGAGRQGGRAGDVHPRPQRRGRVDDPGVVVHRPRARRRRVGHGAGRSAANGLTPREYQDAVDGDVRPGRSASPRRGSRGGVGVDAGDTRRRAARSSIDLGRAGQPADYGADPGAAFCRRRRRAGEAEPADLCDPGLGAGRPVPEPAATAPRSPRRRCRRSTGF